MSDLQRSKAVSDFARSLVDAGKAEPAPTGAAGRAVEHVTSIGAASATATVVTGIASKGAWGLAAVAVLAAAAGVVAFTKRDPTTQVLPTAVEKPEATAVATTPAVTAGPPAPASTARAHAAVRVPSACERVDLPDSPPTECSKPGRVEPFELVDTCATDVDVFWVDFKCRESFVAHLAPGETLPQQTYDTHPWRVRDHATHKLIKEWVGPSQPEPPKEPVQLPDVVIEDGMTAAEGPPSLCSRNSNRASLRFVNKRTTGVSIVFWVDSDCHEDLATRIEPGQTWTTATYEMHAFRVRDENGALLVDYVPTGVNPTVYISLP